MQSSRSLRFGIQAGPTDVPYTARRMAIAGTPEEVALALTPYLAIGFDMFLAMERTPLDHETLRLFMQEVAPRLRTAAGKGG